MSTKEASNYGWWAALVRHSLVHHDGLGSDSDGAWLCFVPPLAPRVVLGCVAHLLHNVIFCLSHCLICIGVALFDEAKIGAREYCLCMHTRHDCMYCFVIKFLVFLTSLALPLLALCSLPLLI